MTASLVILKGVGTHQKSKAALSYLFYSHFEFEASFASRGNKKVGHKLCPTFDGRGGRIRTCDLLLPKQAR